MSFDSALLNDVLRAVKEVLFDPAQRTFWPLLATSVLLGALVYRFRAPSQWRQAIFRDLFSPKLWFHPSALADYQLWLFNLLVGGLFFASTTLSYAWVAAFWSSLLKVGLGPMLSSPLPKQPAAVLFTLAVFVADDFTRFWLHRAMHRSPLLWQIHRVHHSAEVLTPMTLYRLHPIESGLYSLRLALTHGTVTGFGYYLFGTELSALELGGVNAISLCFSALGANLRHSHVWVSFGPALERYLLSPAQHQLHHSDDPAHHGKNLGAFLAVWDLRGGSWLGASVRPERLEFGVSEPGFDRAQHRSLARALWEPLSGLFSRRSRA